MTKKNGKNLEKLVYLIQQSLKDSPNTIILKNHKLKNDKGRKREFDLIIETLANDFKLRIAIECKDYSSRVSVDKIEAFHAKCLRHPEIHKKVFVATNGYQIDAKNAADQFGIDLFTIEEVVQSAILSKFNIIRMALRFLIRDLEYGVELNEELIKQINVKEEGLIYFKNSDPQHSKTIIDKLIIDDKDSMWAITLGEFFRHGGGGRISKPLSTPFQVEFKEAYLIDVNETEIPLTQIKGIVDTWILELPANITASKAFQTIDGEEKAQYMEIGLSPNLSADIVLSKGKKEFYFTDEAGESQKMVEHGYFDPKTGKFHPVKE